MSKATINLGSKIYVPDAEQVWLAGEVSSMGPSPNDVFPSQSVSVAIDSLT